MGYIPMLLLMPPSSLPVIGLPLISPTPPIAGSGPGFFSRAQVLDSGLSDRHIRKALLSKEWVRLRWGYYALAAVWDPLSPQERHVIVLRTIADRSGGRVAFTHHSSALLHNFAVFGQDLSVAHVIRLDDGASRREAGIVHHSLRPGIEDELELVGGLVVTKARTCVWESAMNTTVEGGLVTFNDALHREAVTLEELEEQSPRFTRWPQSRRARLALRLASPKVESAGESRMFYFFWQFGIPRPEPQYKVFDPDGVLLGRSDFGWTAYRHLGEFDGMIKYRRSWRPGEDPGAVVEREKVREDRMRGQAYGMSRFIYRDLDAHIRLATANRTRAELEQSSRLYTRNRVTIPLLPRR
jgi:hypothetical protein